MALASLLKILVSFAGVAIEILGNNITNSAEAGARRNADVVAQVVKALEYPHMPASKVWAVSFSASWQPAVIDRASSTMLFPANVDVRIKAEIATAKQQSVHRPAGKSVSIVTSI